jgi:hypothetical protein
MRDWMKAQVMSNVFDVLGEGARFQSAAVGELREAGLSIETRSDRELFASHVAPDRQVFPVKRNLVRKRGFEPPLGCPN